MAGSIQFKVEQGRTLVPVGEPCPFACKYCYTRGGEVGPPRIAVEEIIYHLQRFAAQNKFEMIMFGYDGDPFARPIRGITMLRQLVTMSKDINFSTKALIEGQTLSMLADIKKQMDASGNTLSAHVSLSCWDSAFCIEPHTPSPMERMLTIRNLGFIGIPAFIAVRPILPNICDTEYERLIDEGLLAGCKGFILGPLYSDDAGRFVKFISPEVLKEVSHSKIVVPWSPHEPVWVRYEDQIRLQHLIGIVTAKGGRVFLSSADAVGYLKQDATHA